jgi:hypothetical protein
MSYVITNLEKCANVESCYVNNIDQINLLIAFR